MPTPHRVHRDHRTADHFFMPATHAHPTVHAIGSLRGHAAVECGSQPGSRATSVGSCRWECLQRSALPRPGNTADRDSARRADRKTGVARRPSGQVVVANDRRREMSIALVVLYSPRPRSCRYALSKAQRRCRPHRARTAVIGRTTGIAHDQPVRVRVAHTRGQSRSIRSSLEQFMNQGKTQTIRPCTWTNARLQSTRPAIAP